MTFLERLNSHHVFGIGLGTLVVSSATIAVAPHVQGAIDAHFGSVVGGLASLYLQGAVQSAQLAIPPSIAALAAGKPLWIGGAPTPAAPPVPTFGPPPSKS